MPKLEIDEDLVRKLSELMAETGLTELEFAQGDQRLRVSRAAVAAAPETATGPPPAHGAAQPPAAEATETHPGAVTAPMVGTVYVAPEPGAEPFVHVGSTVSEGDTLLLIEAMKTYNPVRAPRSGKVARILISDSAPVEFGEVLMIVE